MAFNAERFENKVDRSGNHHLWTGSKTGRGQQFGCYIAISLGLGIIASSCGGVSEGNLVDPAATQASGDGPSTIDTSAAVDGSLNEACGLSTLASASQMAVAFVPEGTAKVSPTWLFTAVPTDDQLKATSPVDLLTQYANVEILTERTVGPNVGDDELFERSLSKVTVVYGQGTEAFAVLPGVKANALGYPAVLADGSAAFVVMAMLTEDLSSVQLEPCSSDLNNDIEEVTRILAARSRKEAIETLITEAYVPGQLDSVYDQLARLRAQVFNPDDYLEEWNSVPLEQRSLQLGNVPESLRGSVQLVGAVIEVPELLDIDGNVTLALWSDLGVSALISLPDGAGPLPLVVPTKGELRISTSLPGGKLSEPLAVIQLPLSPNSSLAIEYSKGSVATESLSDAQLAQRLGLDSSDFNELRASFESQVFRTS